MFENYLLAVDLDGTFFNDEAKPPENNMKALDEFRNNGGLFTVATGRAHSYSKPTADELQLDIPGIVFNGAMVYDFVNEKILYQLNLPNTAREYLLDFINKYPTLGVDILIDDLMYSISTNYQADRHARVINIPKNMIDFDDIPKIPWIKILMMDEMNTIDDLQKYALKLNLCDITLTRSTPHFLEILPKGANKGAGLLKLIDICGYNDRYIITAGDYNNDIEMLQVADLSFAVDNALDEVKEHADMVVCDNNSGAIYEIVEYLKTQPHLRKNKNKS